MKIVDSVLKYLNDKTVIYISHNLDENFKKTLELKTISYMKNKNKVLIIEPHSDDGLISIGGFLKKINQIMIIIFCFAYHLM